MDAEYCAADVIQILENSGWALMAQSGENGTADLCKGYTAAGFAERVFHLHIKPKGDHGELYFRDYLKQHGEIARAYEQLKLGLKERFEHDRDGYTEAKSAFVEKHTNLAREEFGARYLP
ncbi:hypothetical protein FACS1894219_04070 [Clostridia bacterium]|nr:hypothetical protein FACS1894219_04070 [Clostridia bacterium]